MFSGKASTTKLAPKKTVDVRLTIAGALCITELDALIRTGKGRGSNCEHASDSVSTGSSSSSSISISISRNSVLPLSSGVDPSPNNCCPEDMDRDAESDGSHKYKYHEYQYALLSESDILGWTGLHHFAKDGRTACVHYALEFDLPMDINRTNADGNTALHLAVINDRSYIVAALLSYGADQKIRNNLGKMPVDLASANANSAILAQLRGSGSVRRSVVLTPGAATASGSGSDHRDRSRWCNKLRMNSMMLYGGINEVFCRLSDVTTIQKYISDGIIDNIDIEGVNGITCLMNAAYLGFTDVILFLLNSPLPIRINKPDFFGNRPMHYAVNGGSLAAVQLLLDHSADATLTNCNGDSPVQLAAKLRRTDITDILLKNKKMLFHTESLSKPNIIRDAYNTSLLADLKRNLILFYQVEIDDICRFLQESCSLSYTDAGLDSRVHIAEPLV